MTRLTLATHPFLLGFDRLDRLVERTAKADLGGYPPFNIEQTAENTLRITLAIAGFAADDLSITVENRELVIRGKQADDDGERRYLHRGIAARQFVRTYVLDEGFEVSNAALENGLLHVDLVRLHKEDIVRNIPINGAAKRSR